MNQHERNFSHLKVTALAGGVGGARLAYGLAQVIDPPEALSVIVNTGDDFSHLGMQISPDLDTVCYTLAGLNNAATGWGRKDETWQFMQQVREQGLPDWFNIGDQDCQVHLERTRRLQAGETLTQLTQSLCSRWGIRAAVLPMTDDSAPTIVDTVEHGRLGFQEYFVQHRCEPVVKGFIFSGHPAARPTRQVMEAIHSADVIVFCPSNPWVSLDPILLLEGVREALQGKKIIGVSPIIGGKAVKGPAAKMYTELGITPSAVNVAAHYQDLLKGFVIDRVDEAQAEQITEMGISCLYTDTLMLTPERQIEVAYGLLEFAQKIKDQQICLYGA